MPSGDSEKNKTAFQNLYDIITLLRSPEGCPWDREQTPLSLRESLIEEVYETIAAIDNNDAHNLCEELGDMMLLVLLITRMNEETGSFTCSDVLERIGQKLIRRHPHVFEKRKDTPIPEIIKTWDYIKEHVEGKKKPESILADVNNSLPPLEKAYKIQKKAAKVGFDWKTIDQILPKLTEETAELQQAWQEKNQAAVEEEIGDMLFTAVNIARFLKLHPGLALEKANRKFIRRFQAIEAHLRTDGKTLATASFELLDSLWDQVKKTEMKD